MANIKKAEEPCNRLLRAKKLKKLTCLARIGHKIRFQLYANVLITTLIMYIKNTRF